jgi:hypothetical protein
MFTGDFTYEFSTSTDPTLVQQYSGGWFKTDETASSSHLFSGYTPSGGSTLPAASAIDINFATTMPSDDNSSGVDPVTHKVLATRVDGGITVPQAGDLAVGLGASQPADTLHWYVYRWVDLSEAVSPAPAGIGNRSLTQPTTWAKAKALYR